MLQSLENWGCRFKYAAGVAAARIGWTSLAIKNFNAVLASCDEHDAALAQLGVLRHAQGRFEDAVAIYRKLCHLAPDSTTARLGLANALQQLDLHEQAVEQFNLALALDPQNRLVQYNLAQSLRACGKKQDALTLYRRLARTDATDAEAIGNLAATLSELGHWSEALEYHQQAMRLNPNSVHAHNVAVTLFQLNRFEEAEQALRRAIELDLDSTELRVRLAMAIGEQERYTEAISILRELAAGHSSDPTVLSTLVATLIMASSADEACKVAANFVQRNPELAAGHEILGFALVKLKNAQAALPSYDHAISLEPGNAELHAGRGAALSLLGRHREALEAFGVSQRAIPGYVDTHPDFAEFLALSRAAVDQ